jgi:ABC-type polysaccharide/polyol phosphate transport system ATPase subunit
MPEPSAPLAVEVDNLRKSFRIPGPTPRGPGLRRLLQPVRRDMGMTLDVLKGISFDVYQGELFGIIGRNGSGKTTLLRILASIYRPDSGRVRVTGRLGPFLDLGVGFQPSMSARQNVAMNGIILGKGRREVKRGVDEVIEYAELGDWADAQIKNFSSGMRARLAFSSMRQADPDIYLVDEILAAGDDEFREKCGGEFDRLKERGKTIIMVAHGKQALEGLADRAMLIADGQVGALGEVSEVFDAYKADRLARKRTTSGKIVPVAEADQEPKQETEPAAAERKPPRATIETLVVNGDDSDRPQIRPGEPIHLRVEVSAAGWVKGPTLELEITSEAGAKVFVGQDSDLEHLPALKPGHRLVAEVTLENPLTPGSYRLECALAHGTEERSGRVTEARAADFDVVGDRSEGLVTLERTVILTRATSLEPA